MLTTCVGQSLVNQMESVVYHHVVGCSVLTTCVGQSLVNQTVSVV